MYTKGVYLEHNPTWHSEDAPWKARHIRAMLEKHSLAPQTVVEVGAGAGEILVELSKVYPHTMFTGYDISPQAYEISKHKEAERLHFVQGDFLNQETPQSDLVLAIDVIEHVEDCFGFARRLAKKGEHVIFHIPLDLSAQSVLRSGRLLKNRVDVGHIHYFSKETALALLDDAGYSVIDSVYTATTIDLAAGSFLARAARLPRKLLFALTPDFAVRLLGGYSLLVLAKQK